jgi:phosphatidylethanolamine-binding protein (PEBP) family uncharacterized protein
MSTASLPRRTRAALLGAGLALSLAACGSSGRAMDAPAPGATAPPRATSSTAAVTTTAPLFTLSSPAWVPGGRLPASAACPDGQPPPLSWANVPPGTAELVVVMSEFDGDRTVRWLVTGLPPAATGVSGDLPPGAVVRPNTAGSPAYDAPCPVAGSHTYEFQLLALGTTSALPADLPANEAVAQLEAIAGTKRAALTATYTPPAGGAGSGTGTATSGTGSGGSAGGETTSSTGPTGTGG